ncbi:hypothetical protein NPIL_327851 [Nephila pilipes]|uniref:Uncharacterized protein n=1 Tax=Nephila pilipes TaxID=299642 RepID=A0A8X6QUV8_NEPPI|nr:hypothetical protein NPIL_327851 [Nephila pilipes]
MLSVCMRFSDPDVRLATPATITVNFYQALITKCLNRTMSTLKKVNLLAKCSDYILRSCKETLKVLICSIFTIGRILLLNYLIVRSLKVHRLAEQHFANFEEKNKDTDLFLLSEICYSHLILPER